LTTVGRSYWQCNATSFQPRHPAFRTVSYLKPNYSSSKCLSSSCKAIVTLLLFRPLATDRRIDAPALVNCCLTSQKSEMTID
jgi:hypothetical protein